jgi:hypothetical protein
MEGEVDMMMDDGGRGTDAAQGHAVASTGLPHDPSSALAETPFWGVEAEVTDDVASTMIPNSTDTTNAGFEGETEGVERVEGGL